MQSSTTEQGVIRPLCRLSGSVVLDVCFREKVVSKASEVTGLQETEFPADLKQSIRSLMSRWHQRIKHNFDPSKLGEGFASFETQDKHNIIITRYVQLLLAMVPGYHVSTYSIITFYLTRPKTMSPNN